jgi:hypothetical protein
MTRGSRWRMVSLKGRKRVFVGTLIWTFNYADMRFAFFSVPK